MKQSVSITITEEREVVKDIVEYTLSVTTIPDPKIYNQMPITFQVKKHIPMDILQNQEHVDYIERQAQLELFTHIFKKQYYE